METWNGILEINTCCWWPHMHYRKTWRHMSQKEAQRRRTSTKIIARARLWSCQSPMCWNSWIQDDSFNLFIISIGIVTEQCHREMHSSPTQSGSRAADLVDRWTDSETTEHLYSPRANLFKFPLLWRQTSTISRANRDGVLCPLPGDLFKRVLLKFLLRYRQLITSVADAEVEIWYARPSSRGHCPFVSNFPVLLRLCNTIVVFRNAILWYGFFVVCKLRQY